MIRMSPLQMRILGAAATASFQRRLEVHLQSHFPEAFGALAPTARRQEIAAILHYAERLGLASELDVSLLANLYVGLGPDLLFEALNQVPDDSFDAAGRVVAMKQLADDCIGWLRARAGAEMALPRVR